jgi:ABC-2 type transport system permease protein
MNKIFLIAGREFFSRVRKKSFIVMTLLGPLLIAGFYALIIYLSINEEISNDLKRIIVIDESGVFRNKLRENNFYKFSYQDEPLDAARLQLRNEDYFAVLYIPKTAADSLRGFKLIAATQTSWKDESYIEDKLNKVISDIKFAQHGIEQKLIEEINNTSVVLESVRDTKEGLEKGSTAVSTGLGFIGAIFIYMFIFIYGVQIMRGVMEEKTNRIVEVIISSVKPFELMMGKIAGIAMVALLQFLIWVVLSTVLGGGVTGALSAKMSMVQDAGAAVSQTGKAALLSDIISQASQINVWLVGGMFLFFFITGYLFYGALFAAVGAAVDSETDTQQFMLPITIPLILAFFLAQTVVVSNPNGSLATWLSMVPFTSPIIMMVRVPFFTGAWDWSWGWQIIASMCCMLLGILVTTWMAGRIYRIGILLYGKKITYKELGKWLFYKA